MLDVEQQQFHFFATTLFPQDLTLLAWLLIIAAFALFLLLPFWAASGVGICVRKRCGRSFLSGLKSVLKARPTSVEH
ncbi:hypothetical protein PCI56_17440 [Plesiomonas shigelloides subsp. oncorhynchi]|nr:hypothetical protein [Plesiomonas shigelloides]